MDDGQQQSCAWFWTIKIMMIIKMQNVHWIFDMFFSFNFWFFCFVYRILLTMETRTFTANFVKTNFHIKNKINIQFCSYCCLVSVGTAQSNQNLFIYLVIFFFWWRNSDPKNEWVTLRFTLDWNHSLAIIIDHVLDGTEKGTHFNSVFFSFLNLPLSQCATFWKCIY